MRTVQRSLNKIVRAEEGEPGNEASATDHPQTQCYSTHNYIRNLASDDIFCSPRGKREPSRRTEYYSAYLRDGTGIGVQYYIYCSPIPMLQTGIGFKALRGGHKNALGSSAPTSHGPRSDLRRERALWTRREMIAA